jgi:uncharacterized membrane protein
VAVVLLKHVGIILAAFIWAYYVSVRLFIDKLSIKAVAARACVLFALVISTYASWELYVYFYGLDIKFAGTSILLEGDGVVSNIVIGLRHVLTNLFPHSAFLPPAYPLALLTPGIQLWAFICITACLGLIINLNKSTPRKSTALAFGFLVLTAMAYLLFLSYVTVASGWFNDHVSFSRYFLVVLFATFLLQYFVAREGLSVARCLFVAIVMAAVSFVTAPPLSTLFVQAKRLPVPINEEYRLKAEQLKKYTTGNEFILYIDGKDSVFGYFIFRLKTLPLQYKSYSSTFFIYQDDIKNPDRLDRFKKTLCKFDYIYADSAPEDFWKRNSSIFSETGGHVYKVIRDSSIYCTAHLLEK